VAIVEKGQGEGGFHPLEGHLLSILRTPPVRVRFVPDAWFDLQGKEVRCPDGEYVALAGVGDPHSVSRIFHEATGRDAELLAFPDHHAYCAEDVANILAHARGRPIATTEKDAVKLEAYSEELESVRVLKLTMEMREGEDRFWDQVTAALARPGDRL
jgi:tetraacyldisaccharide-1-P 4'-kinase